MENRKIMKRFTRFTAFIFLAVALITAHSSIGQTYQKYFKDGEIYFKYKQDVEIDFEVQADRSVDIEDTKIARELSEKYNIQKMWRPSNLKTDRLLKTFAISFTPFSKIEEIIEKLKKYPELEYAEKKPYHYIDYTPNDSLYNLVSGPGNWNWHHDLINSEQAWDITQGDEDILVAIVDNAVWEDHPDLTDKIVAKRNVAHNNDNVNPPSWGSPADWSHGTHVSGLAVAATDNETGVAGVGFNCSLFAIRASGSNPNGISAGYEGIEWAAEHGADIINCSWGGPYISQFERDILNAAHDMGVIIFAAAGNDNTTQAHYPSSAEHVISVASVDYDDTKSSFSNYSTNVDISSPGGFCSPGPAGLLSTTYDETSMGFYDTYYGTSMASPVAAGAASLILAVNPELTPDEVEDIMKNTAVDIDEINPGYEGMLGAGRIDAYEAVLNTPYAPVSEFSTPVTVITPGTAIDYMNEAEGIPDTYAWTFDGGTPETSTAANPQEITYNEEGIFNVSLTVENEFGTDVLLKEEYITVTSTPTPYVDFASSEENTCILDAVSFTDLSLYNPTEWLWEFNPGSVTYLEGTDETFQNPVVQFDAPGYYEVTLTATNENGSSSLTKSDYIWAQGINLPFDETFESGETSNFTLTANEKSSVKIDSRGAAPGSDYGLHFQGNTAIGGWTGSPTETTPEQAWEENTDFHATASNCAVDATGVSGIAMTLDLKQTYAFGPKNSWFRVLANDEQINDIVGTANFNPQSENDPWEMKMFDLSQFGNSFFSLSLQSACYLADYFYEGKGDNVFVDNITIYNFTGENEQGNKASALMYPVPAVNHVNISVAGIKEDYTINIYNVQGQKVFEKTNIEYVENAVETIDITGLNRGVYLLKLVTNNNELTKKLIVK